MKVYVKFHNGSDITVSDVESTDTKNGYFLCLDNEDDKLFATDERNILYTEFIYE